MSRDNSFKEDEMSGFLESQHVEPVGNIKLSLSNFNIDNSENSNNLKTEPIESNPSFDDINNN